MSSDSDDLGVIGHQIQGLKLNFKVQHTNRVSLIPRPKYILFTKLSRALRLLNNARYGGSHNIDKVEELVRHLVDETMTGPLLVEAQT